MTQAMSRESLSRGSSLCTAPSTGRIYARPSIPLSISPKLKVKVCFAFDWKSQYQQNYIRPILNREQHSSMMFIKQLIQKYAGSIQITGG